LLVFRI
jgi:hypothetical protein